MGVSHHLNKTERTKSKKEHADHENLDYAPPDDQWSTPKQTKVMFENVSETFGVTRSGFQEIIHPDLKDVQG